MRSGRPLDLGLATLLAASLVASLMVDPEPGGHLTLAGRDLGPGCASRYLTGAACPFCGMSHSFMALADGDLAASLRHHPLGPVVAIAFCAFIAAVAVRLKKGAAPVVETRVFLTASSCLLATSIAVWSARMFLG
jgi:hypothetical protein